MKKLKYKIKSILIHLKFIKPDDNWGGELIMKEKNEELIFFQFKHIPFKVRHTDSSDLSVLKQVLIQKEYASVLSFFKTNDIPLQTVVDAGANIGLTSIFFKSVYPDVKIVCIEPDINNFEMLKSNLSFFNKDTILLFKAGLMGKENVSLTIGTEFRGGMDWAKQTIVSTEESLLKSITIPQIMKQLEVDIIDLLKIDIEGAETFLLEPTTDTHFLENTKCIAIEIHDEYNCRTQIYDLLKSKGFLLLEDGETTIALNKHYV